MRRSMALRSLFTLGLMVLCASNGRAADTYSIKTAKTKVPKEVKKPIASLLSDTAVELHSGKGDLLAEIWIRQSIPVKATEDQVAKGLPYQALQQTMILGLMRIHKPLGDYRDQKPKKGIYTMRLGVQPMDGDHMGTAPFASFVILTPIVFDEGKPTVDVEDLLERSTKASGTGHPSIWLLFPVTKAELAKAPQLNKKLGNHQVINFKSDVTINGKKKGTLGIGITLVGVSDAA